MPKFSKAKPMPTTKYLTGKISCSYPKGGFRTFVDCSVGNPSDVCVKWGDDMQGAWAAACARIEDFAGK